MGAKNKFYDTPRTIEILGEDMKPKVVKINQQYLDPETGRMMMHPVADTRYNVTVSTGPSYTSQRQQAFEQLSDYVKAAPGLMAVVGDLIFRNSDMPGADQVADRLEKALPPGLADDKQGAQQIPPQAKAQMDQMSQQIEQMTAALDKATDEARTKKAELDVKKLEMESKERIAAMENQTQILINERKIGSMEGISLLREDMAAIRHRLDLLHRRKPSKRNTGKRSAAGQRPGAGAGHAGSRPGAPARRAARAACGSRTAAAGVRRASRTTRSGEGETGTAAKSVKGASCQHSNPAHRR